MSEADQRGENMTRLHMQPNGENGGPSDPSSIGRPVTRARDIRKQRLRWTWQGRLALGYLAVWCGAGEIGKSLFAAWVIRELNFGRLDGEFRGHPQKALIIASEDGREDMWLPRLEAVGADLDAIEFLNYPSGWNLRDGVSWIDKAIADTGVPLIFIDALMEHMPDAQGSENTRSPTFVRQALAPLANLAKERRTTPLFGLHPRKAAGETFADVVQESGVFTQLPRIGLLFGYHPEDSELPPEEQRRVILRGKGNVGRRPRALSFRIAARDLEWDDPEDAAMAEPEAYVTDVQECDMTARQLLQQSKAPTEREASKTELVTAFMATALSDGEWHESEPIRGRLVELQLWHNQRGADARRQLGVKVRKRPGIQDGPWEWQIPNSFNSTTETDSSPPRATLMPQMTVPFENAPNNNNNGKSQRVNRVERTGETEGEESRVIHTTRARDELPVCSCGDGGAGPDLDGRCERCYGLLHCAGTAPDQR